MKSVPCSETGETDTLISSKYKCRKSELLDCLFFILEKIPIAIIILNTDHKIEFCNHAALRMLGYERNEINGSDYCSVLFPQDIREEMQINCHRLFGKIKNDTEFEQICATKDGKRVLTRWKILPLEGIPDLNHRTIFCIEPENRTHKHNPEDYDKRYVRLIEDGNDGIVVIQDHVIKYISNKLAEITGYSKEEVMGRDVTEFVYPEHRTTVARRYKERLEGKELSGIYEIEIFSKEGKPIPVEITASIIEYEGRIADMAILRDVSERKKAEKDLKAYAEKLVTSNAIVKRKLELERVISYVSSVLVAPEDINIAIEKCLERTGILCGASRVYLFTLNDDSSTMSNTHEWCSESVDSQKENLQGLPNDMFPWWMQKLHLGEIIHVTDVSLMPPEAANEKEILEMQEISSLIVLPLYINRRMSGFVGMDNVINTGEWSHDDIEILGTFANLVGSAIERKKQEEALHRSSVELRNAYEELKELDRMKNEMLANLNHELLTPLHSIKGYSNLLCEGDLGELNEKQKRSVDVILRSSERLGNLIQSLLYMGNVLAGKAEYNFDPIQIENVIDNTIKRFLYQAQQKDIKISKDISGILPIIEADVTFLPQMLDKLVDNAIKFTPEGGDVVIRAYEEGDCIHIEVKDNGIGVPEDKTDAIFGSFYQLDGSSTRRYGGNGIGLHISQQIVNAHKGKIRLESNEGNGTTVHITLPKEHPLTSG
ncbi:MAG: PAS domain S-box protein [Methanolobus sp.]|nr:PAS domain S-box protein [Methanolobus sp.]